MLYTNYNMRSLHLYYGNIQPPKIGALRPTNKMQGQPKSGYRETSGEREEQPGTGPGIGIRQSGQSKMECSGCG